MRTSGKIPRFAWIALAALLTLASVAALATYLLFDQQRWIGLLESHASAATGRQVRVGGLSLHLLPRPGVDVRQVRVANAAWAQAPQLLLAEQVSARLALWPLLIGQVRLTTLSAQGVQLDLEVNAQGQRNWPLPPSRNAVLDLGKLTATTLQQARVRFRSPQFDTGNALIEQVTVTSQPGWHQIEAEALVRRGSRELAVSLRLDELSILPTGRIALRTGSARLSVEGRLPVQAVLTNAAVKLHLEAERPNDLLAFLDIDSRTIAPVTLNADLRETGGTLSAVAIDARLGKFQFGGNAQLDPSGARPTFNAQLSSQRLDWVTLLADAGRPPLPPKPAGELFRDHPFAWRALAALQGWQGTVDVQLGSLRTRPGIELTDVSARALFDDGRVHLNGIKARLLDGSASADAVLTAQGKQAHLDVRLHDVSLQKWIVATGGIAPLTGGPMQVRAVVDASGDSMKEMAASLTGPVSVRLGPAVVASRAGAQAEALLTGLIPMFSARNESRIVLECAAANLVFKDGRAAASPLVGARSQASQLLASGLIDLREQSLDLRGRVRARSGITLGLATLTGDVSITGALSHPQARLDPAGTPSALARLGAAIATGGLSIVGTALWDGTNPGTDPCQAVFLAPPNSIVRSSRRGDKAAP